MPKCLIDKKSILGFSSHLKLKEPYFKNPVKISFNWIRIFPSRKVTSHAELPWALFIHYFFTLSRKYGFNAWKNVRMVTQLIHIFFLFPVLFPRQFNESSGRIVFQLRHEYVIYAHFIQTKALELPPALPDKR